MGSKVTRDDVAKLAGVSPITVSRVFRGDTVVAGLTRDKVMQISRQLGYMPNAGARAIRTRRFERIAFAVVGFEPKHSNYSPTMLSYLSTAAELLAERNYMMVFEHFHLEEKTHRLLEFPRLFTELSVDGVLGVPAGGVVPPVVDQGLAQLQCPVVWVNRNTGEVDDVFPCDEVTGSQALARHLIELGHRNIAYIGFNSQHYSAIDRPAAIQKTLREAGLRTDLFRRDSFLKLEPMIRQLLSPVNAADRPTAVVCYSTYVYQAVMHIASDLGLHVPRDLSLAIFASQWEAEKSMIPITAVIAPEFEMTHLAVNHLLARVEHRGSAHSSYQKPAGQLRVGATTAEPDAG